LPGIQVNYPALSSFIEAVGLILQVNFSSFILHPWLGKREWPRRDRAP